MKISVPLGKKARIEMLPLIDIVFLLLVFFIYAMLSMAVHRGLTVALPVSGSAVVDTRDGLAVSVLADGVVAVDRQRIELEDLVTVLRKRVVALREQGVVDPGVLLFADRDLPYQRLFAVMDRVRQAGIERVSLQTAPEAQGR